MKNILLSKKMTSLTTLFMTFVTAGIFIVFETKCFGNSCGSEAIRGFIKPLIWFGITASILSSVFLFFPEAVFKSWLKKIASWYLAVLFIITATTPVYSSNILSVDRSQVVFIGMILLGLITLVYIIAVRKKGDV